MKMLLHSAKPVTQSLTKIVEPLRQMTKGLTRAARIKIPSDAFNFSLSTVGCLASFLGRLLLEMRIGGLFAVTIQMRFKQFCRRLRRDAEKGSAAIEFAMVAPVFFVFLMGTIEVVVMFFAQTSLQNAVNDAARLIRTGQTACFSLDANNLCVPMTAAQFRTQICNELGALLHNCTVDSTGNSDLQFDVTA
jgi:hypothetical protein